MEEVYIVNRSLWLAVLLSYLRLAMRLLLRPIPRHFSRCGAKREAAMLRLQLGHTHSLFFHWLYTWPNTSNPGWSTISGNLKQAINCSALQSHGAHNRQTCCWFMEWVYCLNVLLLCLQKCWQLQKCFTFISQGRQNHFVLTKVPHTFLVRVIQEKIALLNGPVDLKAKTQACILHQVRQDVLS